jgi:hypothetical protein
VLFGWLWQVVCWQSHGDTSLSRTKRNKNTNTIKKRNVLKGTANSEINILMNLLLKVLPGKCWQCNNINEPVWWMYYYDSWHPKRITNKTLKKVLFPDVKFLVYCSFVV